MEEALSVRPEDCQHLMELAFAFCQSQCLFTAVDIGLFSLLDEKAESAMGVCEKLRLNPRGVNDLLDALVTLRLLKREAGLYSNTPATSHYLVESSPFYIGDFFSFTAQRLYPVWRELRSAIRTGLPQNEAQTEADYYANLGADEVRLKTFLKGMAGLSVRPAYTLATRFPWKTYKSFVDLGGASGSLAVHIVDHHSHLVGAVFDLPSVGPLFEETRSRARSSVRFCPGDFFTDELPRADVYILGHVLHNWSLEEKRKILSRVFDAIEPGGAIIIYEWLLDDRRQKMLGIMDSLNMLLVTRTGCGIRKKECEALLRETGFAENGVLDDEPYNIVIARKA